MHITRETLNALMEFDHVIHVGSAGAVTEPSDMYAPEVYTGDDGTEYVPEPWQLLTGYTQQYSYNGPVMHSSEYIAGKLADDILSAPGYYVALIVHIDEDEPAGWCIAFRED